MQTVSSAASLGETIEPTAPRVPADRLRERLDRTRAAMRRRQIDCLIVAGEGLISHYGYLEFLLGFSPVVRVGYIVVTQDDEPVVLMTTKSDAHFARAQSIYPDVRVAGEGDVVGRTNPTGAALADIVRHLGADAGRIGVVGMDNIMPSRDVDHLRAELPDALIADETGLLGDVKAVKTPDEYDDVIKAGAIADAAFRAFGEAALLTRSTWEIYGEMEKALRRRGARDSLIFISRGPYFLHRPFDEQIIDGDLVTVYVETVAPNGYWVEKAGLFAFGAIADEKRAYAEGALAALDAAGRAMTVGARAGDVAAALEARIAHLDQSTGIWHGHGVGVDHDSPVIRANDTTVLSEGMVIAVHPNLTNEAGTIGVSVADTFLIRDGIAQPISSLPQRINTIGG